MNEILKDKLYLGDYRTIKCQTEKLVQEVGITDFINVATEIAYSGRVLEYFKKHGIMNYKFHLIDYDDFDFYRNYLQVVDLMNLLISSGCRVYIHCHHGVSRAATIVIAYLMHYDNFSMNDAVEYVKERRPIIQPRKKFLDDLARSLA